MNDYNAQLEQMRGYAEKVSPAEQGSARWLMERVGFCTCSRAEDATDFTAKKKSSAKREEYILDVAIERITNLPTDHFVTNAMQRGTDLEAAARMAYESRTGNIVTQTGFLKHPTIPFFGGSPDGLVDDYGIIEIKCPNTRTHVQTILTESADQHLPQIMGNLAVTGRKWCDFISYDDRLPEPLNLFVLRIERDDEYITYLLGGIREFLAEVDAMHKSLVSRITAPPELPVDVYSTALEP